MAYFEAPSLRSSINARELQLSVMANFNLSPQEYEELLRAAGGVVADAHVSLASEAELLGRTSEISGLIGVHASIPATEGRDAEPAWFHYRAEIRTGRELTGPSDKEWDSLAAVAERLVPSHSARVWMKAEFDSASVALGVQLPITLSPSELSGFSEIRGVRLVQPDPEDAKRELYSLIVDRRSEKTVVAQVSTFAETGFDGQVLVRGLERAISVFGLAITKRGE